MSFHVDISEPNEKDKFIGQCDKLYNLMLVCLPRNTTTFVISDLCEICVLTITLKCILFTCNYTVYNYIVCYCLSYYRYYGHVSIH